MAEAAGGPNFWRFSDFWEVFVWMGFWKPFGTARRAYMACMFAFFLYLCTQNHFWHDWWCSLSRVGPLLVTVAIMQFMLLVEFSVQQLVWHLCVDAPVAPSSSSSWLSCFAVRFCSGSRR